ncbi:carbonyl reductase [NADPH] 2-like [Thalassophryne amazonica]|uniref:carbonyl reductase [NADPH] 2-like n=1 Tax=Thalassophryne amazonica TaxID=390379 RepID=UPI001471398C|nr:carbonyl reductase [NADPH] 2-like [Thalassophryne amazonica]
MGDGKMIPHNGQMFNEYPDNSYLINTPDFLYSFSVFVTFVLCRSVYQLTQLCVPHLIKTKGSIVNISSINSERAFPGVLAYCMSKTALDHFTRCLALELAPKQVRVNSVRPGVIITEVHKRAGMDEKEYAKLLAECKQTHALGRPGEVEEVAQSIAFLASDAASFITGVNLPIDGGRHAMCPF